MDWEKFIGQITDVSKRLDALPDKDALSDMIEKQKGRRSTVPVGGVRMANYMGLPQVIRKRAENDQEKELQLQWDTALIVAKAMGVGIKETNSYAKLQELAKGMDGTGGKGAEWVPTEMSREVIDIYSLAVNCELLHPHVDLPHSGFKLPTKTSRTAVYLGSALTAPTEANVGTGSITLDAEEVCGWVPVALSAEEDEIVPVVQIVRNDLGIALAEGFERSMISGYKGDLAITFDNDISATDPEKGYNGYRANAIKYSYTEDFQATAWTSDANLATILAHFRAMRSAMGKYGVKESDLEWIVSPKIYCKLPFLNNTNAKPVTIEIGKTVKLDGISITASGELRDDLNASGVYDASVTSFSGILLVNKSGWVIGDLRRILLDSQKQVKTRSTDIVGSMRKAFEARYAIASSAVVQYGFNVAQ